MIKLKRVYEQPAESDGLRILVERLWPRGLNKKRAAIDLWLKDVAPSQTLRQWFAHDPEKWTEFQRRYWKELHGKIDVLDLLMRKSSETTVTFVYAAHDKQHNSALSLKTFIEKQL